MSTLPYNDVAIDLKVKMVIPKQDNQTDIGPSVEIKMNLQCANRIVPEKATYMAEKFSANSWDDICIKEVAQAALINVADDFTYNDLSDLCPLNERVTNEMIKVSTKIGCNPSEWFLLYSCKIVQYQLPDALQTALNEKTEEHAKWEVESMKFETKKIESERLRFEVLNLAERIVFEAKGKADAQEIIDFQKRNNTQQSYIIEEEHQKNMKENLGNEYSIATYSAAISNSEKMLIGAPNVNLHIPN